MDRPLSLLIVMAVGCMLLTGQQPYPAQLSAPDPAEMADQQHGVARVSVLGGDVNLLRGGSSEPVAAVVNAPLLAQDRLQTAPRSFVEVQLDGVNIVRLAENTDAGFVDLGSGRARVQLGAGTIIFRTLRETPLSVEIETPTVALHPLGASDIRLSVLDNGSTEVNVRAGAVDLFGPRGTARLEAPRSVEVRAGSSGPEFQDLNPPQRDSVDEWSAGRDNELLTSQSYQYTGGDMAGASDLDANGAWVDSQYGPAWAPQSQAQGWAPYSNGQWVDEPYYGWTWVDAEPWGWAPFHYGRWFLNGGHGWCWWPGPAGLRHAWSPAYVGFFGYGGGRGLGWVALAPYEGFHTWWGTEGYRGNGGFYPSRAGLFGSYRNAAYRGSAVGASFAMFGNFRGRFNALPRETVGGATLIQGRLPINGGAARFRFVERQPFVNSRLGVAASRSYVRAPQGQYRSSFNQYTSHQGAGYSSYRPAPQYRAPAVPSPAAGAGWQHFGDPRIDRNQRQSFAAGSNESGWHHFGQPERPRSAPPSTAYRNFASPQPSYRQPSTNAPQYRGGGGGAGYRGGQPSGNQAGSHSSGGGGSHSGNGQGSGRHR